MASWKIWLGSLAFTIAAPPIKNTLRQKPVLVYLVGSYSLQVDADAGVKDISRDTIAYRRQNNKNCVTDNFGSQLFKFLDSGSGTVSISKVCSCFVA